MQLFSLSLLHLLLPRVGTDARSGAASLSHLMGDGGIGRGERGTFFSNAHFARPWGARGGRGTEDGERGSNLAALLLLQNLLAACDTQKFVPQMLRAAFPVGWGGINYLSFSLASETCHCSSKNVVFKLCRNMFSLSLPSFFRIFTLCSSFLHIRTRARRWRL